MRTYEPGEICWADLSSPNPERAAAFYTALLGWTTEVAPEPEAGGYTTFLLDGEPVAAVGPTQQEGQPATWMTYVATDDADATAAAVAAAGGTVLAEPMDVMGYGRMLVFLDPGGAVAAAWQAGSMAGAEAAGRPGATSWHELTTREPDISRAFYGAVFGWESRDVPFEGGTYVLLERAGAAVAGLMPMVGDEWPADLPAHWMVYLEVEDPDAVAERAGPLGGTVSVPPTDTPAGRFAVLTDPTGAVFSIIRSDPDYAP